MQALSVKLSCLAKEKSGVSEILSQLKYSSRASLSSKSLMMPQIIDRMSIPESMKTPAFRITAIGLLLIIAATGPIHYPNDKHQHPEKVGHFYDAGVLILWLLAASTALALGEMNIQLVKLVRYVRERILRQRYDHDDEKSFEETDRWVDFDAIMLVPYVYGIIASSDSLIRTVMGEQSEQRDRATFIASASTTICFHAFLGSYFYGHDERYRITVRPTSLRSRAWVVLYGISSIANILSFFIGRKM
jgi:hypothetical protein